MSSRGKVIYRISALLLFILGAIHGALGGYLAMLGGSLFYVLNGVALVIAGILCWQSRSIAGHVVAAILVWTIAWAVLENGFAFWPLLPRIVVISLIALLVLVAVARANTTRTLLYQPLLWCCFLVISITGYSFKLLHDVEVHQTIQPAVDNASSHFPSDGEWLSYGNTRSGSRYSPLDQINRDNVDHLELLWSVRTGLGGVSKGTPLQVGGHLYTCGAGNVVVAFDADDGREIWRFDPKVPESYTSFARYFTTTCRGVTYYQATEAYDGECAERVTGGTVDARLFAVDAKTGELCTSFGDQGFVDLTRKMGEVKPNFYMVTSPVAIVRDNIVVGGWVMDNYEVHEPSGVVRAFNAVTGQFSWAWDMGRPGSNQEPAEGEIYTRGTPNVWSMFSVDEERGIVFAPTGNETPDYFGAGRHAASEQYASSVVALDGSNGKLLWSFQTVHHDIWDYDAPSQPVLIDLPGEDGESIPALIQATKRGEIFLLNRVTGEPIAAVEERPVPQGGVPEDWTAPTQPFSAMPNLHLGPLEEKDMWGISPIDHLICRIRFNQLRYEGHFTPPTTGGIIQYPGNVGGHNWGSVSIDPDNHLLVVNPMNLASELRLVPREEMEQGVRASPQYGTPYGASTQIFVSPLGVPCTAPPYGLMAAIDLKTQQLLWKRPVGTANDLGPAGIKVHLPVLVGTPQSAGTVTTKGGLIFQSGTMDRRARAYDAFTGEQLWSYTLPQSSQATPMSYLTSGGKQVLIVTMPAEGISFGGDRNAAAAKVDPLGGYIFAFALPDDHSAK
ncbi:membrane-bound PQQ-dependent dehydrogenase, glucose/quinate/shikimate family [Aurantivibrio plasticivorans]